ncbi:hypothetical protein HELRODRAFT_76128 [Helobdella robusta]|uniref:MARVEL domain-containing protein n=1 Tax=Helobdella robusta TaxID=6412 RepID=T1G2F4_HELRO|nr:hypothetical protein HELRODRAFT_76128 [Helobdella robusta]ESO07622.1 hypothetical protein HELRODRAFT_76128 [Helobdella robusta]
MSNFNENNFSQAPGAYGSVGAGGQFDPATFFKKPQVVVRLISLLFAIIVAGCVGSQGWEAIDCKFNKSPSTCNFAVFMGTVTCIIICVFLVFDVLFDNISNVIKRKYIVIADLISSALTTFLWLACFSNLVDKWKNVTNLKKTSSEGESALQATIAFSFFSIITFGILTGLAVKRYREGVTGGDMQGPSDYNTPDPFANPEESFTP